MISLNFTDGLSEPTDMGMDLIESIVEDIFSIHPDAALIMTTIFKNVQKRISRFANRRDSIKPIGFCSDKVAVKL